MTSASAPSFLCTKINKNNHVSICQSVKQSDVNSKK